MIVSCLTRNLHRINIIMISLINKIEYTLLVKTNFKTYLKHKEIEKMKKISKVLLGALLAMGLLVGCGSNTAATSESITPPTDETLTAGDTPAETPEITGINGSVTMAGSTSMEKLANALKEAFMAENQEVTVTAEFTGSGAGVEAVLNGMVDIGNSSRALTEEEKAAGVVENIVAIDGIGVIVNSGSTVEDITKEQLAAIYKGEITNWSALGGEEEPVIVIGREAGSGTRGAFEELLELKDLCKYAQEIDSTGAVVAKVVSTPGAIGYVSVDVIDNSVKPLKIEGVEPTVDNIKNGSYTLSRPFVMATKGDIAEQSDVVKALFDYIQSDAGQELIASVGLVTVE